MSIDWSTAALITEEDSDMRLMVDLPQGAAQDSSGIDWSSAVVDNEPPEEKEDGARMVDSLETETDFEVDFGFLRSVEGFETSGYIPTSKGKVLGQSGVTIGSGVDLGHQSRQGLINAGVDIKIVDEVEPYLGLRKTKALDKLRDNPLKLSDESAEAITTAMI